MCRHHDRAVSTGPYAGVTAGLEQVYGAITYYLAHREELHRYLEARQQDFDGKRGAAREADPMFYRKLADAKKQTPLTR